MLFHDGAFFFNPNFNFSVDPLLSLPQQGESTPVPPAGDFLLLDGTDFLLLDGTDFLLLGS